MTGEIETAFNEHIGSKIRRKRRSIRMTQIELAALIGVHRNTLNRWETCADPVPVWMLLRVADVIGINHLLLLPPREYTWGAQLVSMVHERDGRRNVRKERDPDITEAEEKRLLRPVYS